MRVLLVGMGSRGDVQPFIALGESLHRLGHIVTLAAAEEFRDLVLRHDLGFEPLSVDLRSGIETDIGREWLGGSSTNQVREARLMRTVMRHVYATFQPVWPTAFGASSTFALQPRSRSVLNLGCSWLAAQAAWSVVRSTGDLLRRRRALPGRTMLGYAAAARRTPSLLAAPLPGDVLAVEAVPHDWLFPRCAAVVHHGGAGTTAAALRGGTPQVVVPHIADQPYWGRRVAELGVGSVPLARKHFDADRLGQVLDVALSPTVTSTARDLGARIRDEDGVGDAANLMHALFSRAG